MQNTTRKAPITQRNGAAIPSIGQPHTAITIAGAVVVSVGLAVSPTTSSRVRTPGAASVRQNKPDPGILADVLTDVAAMFAAVDSDVLEAA